MGEHGDGLAGVAEDILRLGVGVGFLMELFDPGHFVSGLGDLDAPLRKDGLEVDAKEAGVESAEQSAPGAGEFVQIRGRAVEEVQEAVVAGRLQAQGAPDAGDPQQISASGESRQAEGHACVRSASTGRFGSGRRRTANRTPEY